jgi:hypothetical protein
MNKTLSIHIETNVTTELITKAQVKQRLKIEHEDEDTMIDELIKESRSLIENFCGISIGEQERVVTAELDREYYIPFGPVSEIYSAEIDGDESDRYELDGNVFQPAVGGKWKLSYICGYTATTLPLGLKSAWMDMVGYLYENRGDMSIPISIKQKLNPFTRNYGI